MARADYTSRVQPGFGGDGHDAGERAAAVLRALFAGERPVAEELAELGPYAAAVESVVDAFERAGAEGARRSFEALARTDRRLPALLAGDAVPETLATRWRTQELGLGDAFQPLPPIAYVVGRLFQLPSLNILYGPPGTYKSLLLADAAVCVAAGKPWLEPLKSSVGEVKPFSVTQAPVVWLDFDNGRRRTLERFGAVGRAHKIPPETPVRFVSMPDPWLDLSTSDCLDVATYLRAHEAKLVVIDNLGAVSGGLDENKAEMIQVMAHLRRISELAEVAVVLIHHQRKSYGEGARAGDTLRGHSSIEAALDLALRVEREPQSESVVIRATKVRGNNVAPFGAVFAHEPYPTASDLREARFFGYPIENSGSDSDLDEVLLELLHGRELNQVAVIDAIKKTDGLESTGKHRVRARLEKLEASGKLTATTKGKSGKWYQRS